MFLLLLVVFAIMCSRRTPNNETELIQKFIDKFSGMNEVKSTM